MGWLSGRKRTAPERIEPKPPPPPPRVESDSERDERLRTEASRELAELMRLGAGVYFPADHTRRTVARLRAEQEDG